MGRNTNYSQTVPIGTTDDERCVERIQSYIQCAGSPPLSSIHHRDRTRTLVSWSPRHIVTPFPCRTPNEGSQTTKSIIYYESTKRNLKTKYICGCRCYERLQPNTKEFTHLSYTELVLELEYLKIETRFLGKYGDVCECDG